MSDFNETQKEQERNFIKSLRSGNRTAILSTLKNIRVSGKVFLLSEIFDLLLDQEDEQIYKESLSLLNDLKNKEAVPILTEAITNPEYESIRQELVASCWQSGLSYSQSIGTFIDLAIRDNFATAIEAFTVIEDCIGDLEKSELKKHIDYIKQHLDTADPKKELLLQELIKVMERY